METPKQALLDALTNEGVEFEATSYTMANAFASVIEDTPRRFFPGWSRELEAAFKEWVAYELRILVQKG